MFKLIRNFFWFCSGVNNRILESCDTDHTKYFAIGATVFFTACFAGMSGAYALYFVFSGSSYAFLSSIFFGLMWGLAIFNIDRYLVISIRKENKPYKEFLSALPRILMALMIGVVIARPLELKIFDKEIREGLKQYYLENQQTLNQTVVNNFNVKHQNIILQLSNKKVERDSAKSDLKKAENLCNAECLGKLIDAKTTGKFGDGPNCKLRKQEVIDKTKIYTNLDTVVLNLEKKISELQESSGLNNSTYLDDRTLDSIVNLSGFYDRNKILGQISSWTPFDIFINKNQKAKKTKNKDKNFNTVQRLDGENDKTVFFISMLIILIECLPIIVKLMSKRGVYDIKLDEEEDLTLFLSRNENISNKHLIKELSIAQREVLNKAIEEWKNNEMNDDNISNNYINRRT